jgi:hypothetical protein
VRFIGMGFMRSAVRGRGTEGLKEKDGDGRNGYGRRKYMRPCMERASAVWRRDLLRIKGRVEAGIQGAVDVRYGINDFADDGERLSSEANRQLPIEYDRGRNGKPDHTHVPLRYSWSARYYLSNQGYSLSQRLHCCMAFDGTKSRRGAQADLVAR